MARGRAPTYDDQRDAILAAAAALFAHRGYSATSMNQVAEACGVSKATLYHYFRDKYALLVQISEEHVQRLHAVVQEVEGQGLPPEARLRELILRFMSEYAHAQHAHRVLTEDVRFLEPDDHARVVTLERQVVQGIARAVAELHPELAGAGLDKPLTMLLFGMINWMFTWMRPDGPLGHDEMAPIVTQLVLGGLTAVRVPEPASATAA